MRTAVQKVSKFVLQSPTQVRAKRNPTLHLSVHGFCILDHSPLEVCLAVAIPSKDEEEPRHRISPCMDFANWTIAKLSPCMDFANWTIASLLTFLSPTTPILSNTNHATRFLEKGEDGSAEGLEVCFAFAKPCQRRSRIRHRISPYMDQTCSPIPVAPSSENDVLSQPANR